MSKYIQIFLLLIFISFTLQDSFTDKNQYPIRKSIKGLQPDFQDLNQIIGNEVHGVAINFVWEQWQPEKKTSCSSGEVLYNGYCYKVIPDYVNIIRTYTKSKVVVTGVLYGVPKWGRGSCGSPVIDPIFCAPTKEGAEYYGRFVAFIAWYFNGENGNGRVADFVIHNEVNAIDWFNYGCSVGNCNIDTWTTIYAQSWNSAYDKVKKEQPNAKVLISFQHDFFKELDKHSSYTHVSYSAETFLEYLVPKLGKREWRLAYHAYPIDLLNPAISANDYPYITFGNIGVLAGWLHSHYPDKPYTWEIQLTENGINGVGASKQASQQKVLCDTFKNVLGTPGIESLIYHRLVDHPVELNDGLGCGLWDPNLNPKPAWTTFALANRKGVAAGYPSCGFEYLPYVKMTRAYNKQFHYVSTRTLPSGFVEEISYKILREKAPDTTLVYECRVGGPRGSHTLISKDPQCEGQFNMGPMGYIHDKKVSGSIPIYRCLVESNGDHFISHDSWCEKQKVEAFMGYVFMA